jgi:hypothetical protein
MPKFTKISTVLVAGIACLSFSAIGASAASAASDPLPVTGGAGAGCYVVGSGAPGYDSFKLQVDSNICRVPVEAAVECELSFPNPDPGGEPSITDEWAYGPVVTGGTSEANCGPLNITFLTYGFDAKYSGAWHYTKIGTGSE